MKITREQYETDMRAAKAQALRDAVEAIAQTAIQADKSTMYKDGKADGLVWACRIIESRAVELDSQ